MKIDDLTPDETATVIDFLADTDSLFTPFRGSPASAWPSWFERRELYYSHGIAAVSSAAATDRKSAERHFDALEAAGWIHLSYLNGRRHIRLSDDADWILRSLVCCRLLSCCWRHLQTIAGLTDIGCSNEGHVFELHILGIVSYGRRESKSEILGLEMFLLPALCRDFVRSHCDCDGRTGYILTEIGRESWPKIPEEPGDLPPLDEQLSDRYDARFTAGLEDRKSWRSPHRHHLAIPLSAGLWPATPVAVEDDQ